jgi:hypothetical protein
MSLEVIWARGATVDLHNLPDWRLAETVARAVFRHASEGIGFVLHVRVDDGPIYRP